MWIKGAMLGLRAWIMVWVRLVNRLRAWMGGAKGQKEGCSCYHLLP